MDNFDDIKRKFEERKTGTNPSKLKEQAKIGGGIIGGLFLLILLFNMFTFQVLETEQAVVIRFGEVQKVIVDKKTPEIVEQMGESRRLKDVDIVEGKGLHVKMPLVDSVEYYSDRLITYDTRSRQVTTSDKKRIDLDNYAQWEITNPALFRVTMMTAVNANTRLDDMIYSNLNSEIGRTSMTKLVSDVDHMEEMIDRVTLKTNESLSEYGIRIDDIQIRKTDLPDQNLENIYNRMRTERERIANRYLSEGNEEAQKIRSSADRDARIIEGEAYEKAENLRGEGESMATKIYAESYNQDPDFYEFYRSLQAYEVTLDDETTIVIPADSEFAKYLYEK